MVMPLRGRSLPAPEPVPAKSRRYRSSLAFAQMLAPKDVIAAQRFVHYDGKGSADPCVICLEEAAAAIVSLPCGHRFHIDCIWQWFEKRWDSGRKARCSLCRRTLHGSRGYGMRLDGTERGHRRRPDEPSHARASSPTDTTRARRYRMTDVPGRLPLGWLIACALDRADILAGPGHPLMLGRGTWDKHLAGVLELLCHIAGSERAERQLGVFVAEFRSLGDALGELRRCEDPA
ncbi:hypothetical protein DL766_000894 [Monosporascus sp. MC13-8B]|uniref:RING-type domain-containing protein n=1 Tax=Monosporascus cannonballus TaxID=155416 RepID=A0ABY0HDM2_9PEZI|nr:hypothetical protein DL762_003280 [Monosporascus cannonballus]RYP00776.1 hypothetical protein DL763_000656 [Monosporascus cannonballus]RYP38477.1 hypothetical protein DL766_000894 [Monosporascus sp. MC13-8B]